MKLKQILILGGIFLVLMLGVFVKNLQRPAELVTEEYAALDLAFDRSQITKIRIEKTKGQEGQQEKGEQKTQAVGPQAEGTATELVKENDQWRVATLSNARADKEKVEDLLTEIHQAKGELRGKGKDLFGDFGIHDEGTFHVLLQDAVGKAVLNLILGNKKVEGSVFIRRKDSEEIFLTEAGLFNLMGIYGDPAEDDPDSNYWAATEFIAIDLNKVERLEIRRFRSGKEILTAGIVKDPQEKKWKYTRDAVPFALGSEKVEQFLNTVKSVRAQKVLDPKAQDYGFSKPTWQMKLGLEGGEEVVVSAAALDSKTNAHPVQVSGEPVVFHVSKYYLENVDVDDSRFFADNPFQVEADKVEKLVVRTGKVQFSVKPKEKKWQGLEDYLNDLKNFKVERLLFDAAERKKVESPGNFWLEVQREGGPLQTLDAGALVSEAKKEYAALKRNTSQPFAISESIFKQLFENLDRLTEPKTA